MLRRARVAREMAIDFPCFKKIKNIKIKEIRLQNYLFNQDVYEIAPKKRLEITDRLRKEMIEIYSGMNIY